MRDNRGSAVVEATLVMPFFIFAMVAIFYITQVRLTEDIIYEAAVETVEYMAEYSYLSTENILLPDVKFEDYVDDKKSIEKYVAGGVKGVDFNGTTLLDDDGYVVLKVNYKLKLNVPFMPKLSKEKSFKLKQKAYIGDDSERRDRVDENDRYVYVTENQSVYHNRRDCSHLMLKKHTVGITTANALNYSPCEFCAVSGYTTKRVIITEQGNRYHMDENCSGLKRTVNRVKLSEVSGLGECSRCGY